MSLDDLILWKASLPPQTKWRSVNVLNQADAVTFLNASPAQGAGQAFTTEIAGGMFDVFFYY